MRYAILAGRPDRLPSAQEGDFLQVTSKAFLAKYLNDLPPTHLVHLPSERSFFAFQTTCTLSTNSHHPSRHLSPTTRTMTCAAYISKADGYTITSNAMLDNFPVCVGMCFYVCVYVCSCPPECVCIYACMHVCVLLLEIQSRLVQTCNPSFMRQLIVKRWRPVALVSGCILLNLLNWSFHVPL